MFNRGKKNSKAVNGTVVLEHEPTTAPPMKEHWKISVMRSYGLSSGIRGRCRANSAL